MPPSRAHLQLGNSWVVEGENESFEEETKDGGPYFQEKSSPKPEAVRHRPTRTKTQSPEPELVMPSWDPSSMDGSWTETPGRIIRPSNNSRFAQRPIGGGQQRSNRFANSNNSLENSTDRRKSKKSVERRPVVSQDALQVMFDYLEAILFWSVEVLGRSLRLLKTPISYLLAVWMLFGLGIIARNLITTSVYASLSPICRLPGTSLLNLPFCLVSPGSAENIPPVEFDQLMTVQSKFEEVLEETSGSVALPMEMKRGEASIRDLRQLVKYSHINSKNELVLEFDGFIDTARIASYDLQKFNSHIGRAVDNVLATTRWTTRVLDGIQLHDVSRGAISAFINDKLLAPFQPVKFTESALLDQYIKHTQIVEEEINKLIDEAQALLMVLGSLEDRLDIIHGVVIRDNMHARAKKDEILSELWTMVGGNRGKLNKMNKQLSLLQQVGVYRQSAYAHVCATIVKLQEIGAGLEDLRERVVAPELLRDRVHVPLAVHIENIQRGVERLEDQRQIEKKAENEHIRQTLERGQLEGTLIDS